MRCDGEPTSLTMPSVLLLAGLALSGAPSAAEERGVDLAQVVVRSHVVIRVETVRAVDPPLQTMFRERKGPRCVAMGDIAGAAIILPGSVDIVLRGGDRLRARFAASCPALDYYSGFYIVPTADAKFCAGRDMVRDRAGGACAVERIKALVPRR